MAGSVFLDANILLEVLLDRKKAASAKHVLTTYAGQTCISSLTCHLVIYYAQKAIELPILKLFLNDHDMLDLTSQDFEWAFNNVRDDDFEDALQIGIAIRAGCEQFITFDRSLFKNYKNLRSIRVSLAE